MTPKQSISIPETLANLRLDQVAAQLFPDYSRARLQTWIKNGQLTVDGKVLRPRDKVLANQTLDLIASAEPEQRWQAQAIELDIVHEDSAIIVINKPPGLVVHPGAGNPDQTLVNALLHYAPELAELPRAGIVHRIDKDTSGLLVIARTLKAHHSLVQQLQAREMKREYLALVQGEMVAGGSIDAPIGRHPRQRIKMAVVENGKPAVTHYRIAERFKNHILLSINLETGRTHQIRVHLAHIHYPIVGDKTYAGRAKLPAGATEALRAALQGFGRQALHAEKLQLIHPDSQEIMNFTGKIPPDMRQLLDILRENQPKGSQK